MASHGPPKTEGLRMTGTRIHSAFPLAAAILLGGCLGSPDAQQKLDSPASLAPGGAPEATAAAAFDRPAEWRQGDWWTARLALDLGRNFYFEVDGRIVAEKNGDGTTALASGNREFGVWDNYFDNFYHGPVDADLNPRVGGQSIKMYDWPLEAGKNWTTPWMPGDPFDGLTVANLRVEGFEDGGRRLRVQGETTDGTSIDYDYNPQTGWLTYFRMVNITTGRIWASLDLGGGGHDYNGEVHRVQRDELYAAFKFGLPVDPSVVPTPDVVPIEDGYAFLEYIRFVGVFPVTDDPFPVGGGAAAATIVAPDGSPDSTTTEGAFEFHYQFERNQVDPYRPGDYKVLYALTGTAGAFVMISGFHDDVVHL